MIQNDRPPILKVVLYLLFLILVYVIETANMPFSVFGLSLIHI